MTDLIAARSTMALSLGFHIIFACVGMSMPFFMAAAHYRYLRSGNKEQLALTKLWMRGTAIFFAIGAVSGTALSFELGLLWPGFMEHAGAIIGMPFSWEGTAFFLEAIALGIFLYGWNRISPWTHWTAGLFVGITGVASGIFVVSANAWMNAPQGFDWVNGEAINVDPVAAMFNEAWLSQALHMTIASFEALGFAVAGVHALLYLRGKSQRLHAEAVKITLSFGAVAALIQPFSGHFSAQDVAQRQPAKLAAMEAHFHTEKGADLVIGGLPNVDEERVDYAIRLPGFLSFLAHNDFDAEVIGLDQFPRDEWPPVLIVHIAFQIMVALGTLLAAVGALFFFLRWKRKELPRWYYKILVVCLPLGFIALEAGWTVTEVGRQPWIIYEIMRTSEAVTPMPGMVYHFFLFLTLYLFLSAMAVWLLKRQMDSVERAVEGVKNA